MWSGLDRWGWQLLPPAEQNFQWNKEHSVCRFQSDLLLRVLSTPHATRKHTTIMLSDACMCFYFHTNQSFSLETVFSLLSVPVVPLCRFKSMWFVWSLLALYSQVLFLRCHWNTFTFCALPWTDQRISAALRLTWTILGKTEEPEDSQSTFLPSPTAVGSTGELEGSSSR